MTLKDRFRGCIVGLAVGDALGYPVEFISASKISETYPEGLTLKPGAKYSDDTQMTICIAEALIAGHRDSATFCDKLSENFGAWYKTQIDDEAQRRAPGNTCMEACERLVMGRHWSESGLLDGMGCGSAMRSAPIGLFFYDDITRVVEYGISSSEVTHSHPSALCSSVATALCTSLALNNVPVGTWGHEVVTVTKGISQEFNESIQIATELVARGAPAKVALTAKFLGEGWLGYEAVASALFCCMTCPDFKSAVRMGATTNGDSDSIACIAGAWMGAKVGLDGIPKDWVANVEDSEKLIDLADRLYNAKIEASK
jgi:ADP-ribosylglycohydrolase